MTDKIEITRDLLAEIEQALTNRSDKIRYVLSARIGKMLAAPVTEPQGEPVWVFTDEDGHLAVTDRWDVAKHLPFETTRYTREQPDLAALQEENRILREGMKGDYDLDAWLEWAATSKALRKDLAERNQDYDELSVENDHLLERACAFEQRNSELVELLGAVKESPTVLEMAFVPAGWFGNRDAALAPMESEKDETEKKYHFETEAYGVLLSQAQWTAVHAVFDNYNEADGESEEFTMSESSENGLVSEILVALELARGE